MTNRLYLSLLLGGLAALPSGNVHATTSPGEGEGKGEYVPPNVIVIMVDDLGIDQLACYDDQNRYDCPYPYAYTPNIDQLAEFGVRFTQARAMPLCSPTRAAFQSGKYPRRTGCGSIVDEGGASDTFDEFAVAPAPKFPFVSSVARELGAFGYEAGMFGKLHLHLEKDCNDPTQPGTGDRYAYSVLRYHHFEGLPRNPDNEPLPLPANGSTRPFAFTYYYWVTANATTLQREVVCSCPSCPTAADQCTPAGCALPGCPSCYQGEYATRKQRLAIQSWIQAQEAQGEPYFALWSLNDIHGPTQWPPALVDPPVPDVEGHYFGPESVSGNMDRIPGNYGNTRLRAKLEYVDSSIGMLLENIDRSNTVIMLVGDNGTQSPSPQTIQNDEQGYPDPVHGYPTHPGYRYTPKPRCAGTPEFSWAPYDVSHFKDTSYEGGVRVPLIVAGPSSAVVSPGRSSDALVDIVDFYETLRELGAGPDYVPPPACSPSVSMSCSDSISFACVLANSCDAGSHARQYSHGGTFWPNSSPPDPDLSVYGDNDSDTRDTQEYYLRREPNGRLWKIVRTYRQDSQGQDCYSDEFFMLNLNPLEDMPLPTGPATSFHGAYNSVKTDFDTMFPPHLGLTNICD